METRLGMLLKNRYKLVAMLGQGGMAAVYRAFDILLEEDCAVKEFRLGDLAVNASKANEDGDATRIRGAEEHSADLLEKATRQFFLEARLLAKLTHDHLPKVTDYFDEGGNYYLVMSLIEGKDLETLQKENNGVQFSEKQVKAWIIQVIDAVDYCHKMGVIHRDIKPSNVMVAEDGKATLIDFGIAIWDDLRGNMEIGLMAKSEGFSPPEQYRHSKIDNRSDIYSLGALIYALLTAQAPTEADKRCAGIELKPPREINDTISSKLEGILYKALSLEPEDRFPAAREFKQALENDAPSRPSFATKLGSLPTRIKKSIDQVKETSGTITLSPLEEGEPLHVAGGLDGLIYIIWKDGHVQYFEFSDRMVGQQYDRELFPDSQGLRILDISVRHSDAKKNSECLILTRKGSQRKVVLYKFIGTRGTISPVDILLPCWISQVAADKDDYYFAGSVRGKTYLFSKGQRQEELPGCSKPDKIQFIQDHLFLAGEQSDIRNKYAIWGKPKNGNAWHNIFQWNRPFQLFSRPNDERVWVISEEENRLQPVIFVIKPWETEGSNIIRLYPKQMASGKLATGKDYLFILKGPELSWYSSYWIMKINPK